MADPKNGERFRPAAASKWLELIAVRSKWSREDVAPVSVMKHTLQEPDPRATFALTCIERWGMVMGKPDGEDSGGRAKIGLMQTAEIVARAFDAAEAAFAEIDRRGWAIVMPSYQDLVEQTKAQEDAND